MHQIFKTFYECKFPVLILGGNPVRGSSTMVCHEARDINTKVHYVSHDG
jgi:hypothetical protein